MQKIDKVKRDTREIIDREIITNFMNSLFLNTNFEYKEYQYEYIDMCLTGSTRTKLKTYDIEIKSRDIPIYRYDNCFLEKKKYDAIMNKQYTNETKLYIALYHQSNAIVVWNLNEIKNIEQYKTYQYMNDITCSTDSKKKYKEVFELPFNIGKTFPFNCDNFYKTLMNYANDKQNT